MSAQAQGGRSEEGAGVLGGLGGLLAMAVQNPQLVRAVMGMLGGLFQK
ncbi:MAG: hypothetical protein ACTS8S_05020 [Giesbergeria sp.]